MQRLGRKSNGPCTASEKTIAATIANREHDQRERVVMKNGLHEVFVEVEHASELGKDLPFTGLVQEFIGEKESVAGVNHV